MKNKNLLFVTTDIFSIAASNYQKFILKAGAVDFKIPSPFNYSIFNGRKIFGRFSRNTDVILDSFGERLVIKFTFLT